MTGIFIRVGKENKEIEFLNQEELKKFMEDKTKEEVIEWMIIINEKVKEVDIKLSKLLERG